MSARPGRSHGAGERRPPSPAPSLQGGDPLAALRERRVIVCVGAGGVGKTTIAASLALRAAAEGRKVMVLTIDPAKRLANALGLEELGNTQTRVDPARIRAAGLEPKGELWAMMLDLQRSWDDFIERHIPQEQREKLLENRFYQTLSTALAGSQEYIATEKLYELHARGDFDLIVLDTPPTAHALDFLDAPKRILDFLENDSMRFLAAPALAAGKLGMKLMGLGGSWAARAISRLTGTETLEELFLFMREIQGTYEVFKDRAAKVKALFASEDSAFVLVTNAQGVTVDETIYFHELLREEQIPVAAVVANRVHRDFLQGEEVPSQETLANALAAAGHDPALELLKPRTEPGRREEPRMQGGRRERARRHVTDEQHSSRGPQQAGRREGFQDVLLTARLHLTLEEAEAMARLDRKNLDRLAGATSPTPQLRVPRFDTDVYDLAGLRTIGQFLFSQESPAS